MHTGEIFGLDSHQLRRLKRCKKEDLDDTARWKGVVEIEMFLRKMYSASEISSLVFVICK